MNTEVFTLFQKYRDLLRGEVRNSAQARWIGSQCARIANRLNRRGCDVCSRVHLEYKKDGTTGEVNEIIHHFELFLVLPPPNNQTPIAVAETTTHQFSVDDPGEISFEAMLARADREKIVRQKICLI